MRQRLARYSPCTPEPDIMRRQTTRPSILTLIAAASLAATVSACATSPAPEGGYLARTEKLAADCEARGGILAPTGGQSGRPETDNVCKITGGASRLTPRN
jgi:hypothetical protein